MKSPTQSEVPDEALWAASFAQSLVADYIGRGGDPQDLFTAFAGLVCARDGSIAGDCLLALEGALATFSSAKPESGVPSA
jgi:hypothetical protein